jgi:hypothetical protein
VLEAETMIGDESRDPERERRTRNRGGSRRRGRFGISRPGRRIACRLDRAGRVYRSVQHDVRGDQSEDRRRGDGCDHAPVERQHAVARHHGGRTGRHRRERRESDAEEAQQRGRARGAHGDHRLGGSDGRDRDERERGAPLTIGRDRERREEGDSEARTGEGDGHGPLERRRLGGLPGRGHETRRERMHEAGEGDGEEPEEDGDRVVEWRGETGDEQAGTGRDRREGGDARDAEAGEAVPREETRRGDEERGAPVGQRIAARRREEVVRPDGVGVEVDEHDGERADALGGRRERASPKQGGGREGRDRDRADDGGAPDEAEVDECVDEEEDRGHGDERDTDDEQHDLHARTAGCRGLARVVRRWSDGRSAGRHRRRGVDGRRRQLRGRSGRCRGSGDRDGRRRRPGDRSGAGDRGGAGGARGILGVETDVADEPHPRVEELRCIRRHRGQFGREGMREVEAAVRTRHPREHPQARGTLRGARQVGSRSREESNPGVRGEVG